MEQNHMNNHNHVGNNDSENSNNSDDDIINWNQEAAAIIRDVKDHVREIFVSEILNSNQLEIYINLMTLENEKYCIRASVSGFQIAGINYDTIDRLSNNIDIETFETPYSLLNRISPEYRNSFANDLREKIQNLFD